MKNILVTSLLVLLFATVAHADKGNRAAGFDKTAHGLLYKIYKHGNGTAKAKVGDFIEMNIQQVYSENDSILLDTRKVNNNQPVELQLKPANFDGDIPEGFTYLVAGDSAIFLVSVDTLAAKMPGLPPFFKKGNYLEFRVVMVSIKSEAEMKKEQTEKSAKQISIDDKQLQDYFKQNNIKPSKTASGLYYTIQKEGTGAKAKPGQKVSMKYTGMLLNGSKFDSNVDSSFHHTDPLDFVLGQGQVIKGWDEGIALFNKGTMGTLYIPSTLAYGDRSPSPMIPANSVMVFEVELLDIKNQDGPNQQAPVKMTKPTPPVKRNVAAPTNKK